MLNVERWHVDSMIQIFHSFSKFSEENYVFLHEGTGHSGHIEKNIPQPVSSQPLVEKGLKCYSTGAIVTDVPSACSQTKGGKLPAPVIHLVMFLHGHEMQKVALGGFPAALRKSMDHLGL